MTPLDELNSLGDAVLVRSPGGGLRVAITNRLFEFDGSKWSQGTPLGFNLRARALPGMATLVSGNGVFLMRNSRREVEYAIAPITNPFNPVDPSVSMGTPTWRQSLELSATLWSIIPAGDRLYMYVDKSVRAGMSGLSQAFGETQGRHGDLVCYRHDRSTPQVVSLRFMGDGGLVPALRSGSAGSGWGPGGRFSRWGYNAPVLEVAGRWLAIYSFGHPGIWLVPQDEIDQALDRHDGADNSPAGSRP